MSIEFLGERIKQAREKLGWNRLDLGRKLNLTRDAIQKIEKGERMPSSVTLKSIANTLSVSTDYLLGNRDISEFDDIIHNNKIIEFFRSFQNLSEPHKNLLEEQIEFLLEKNRKAQAALDLSD